MNKLLKLNLSMLALTFASISAFAETQANVVCNDMYHDPGSAFSSESLTAIQTSGPPASAACSASTPNSQLNYSAQADARAYADYGVLKTFSSSSGIRDDSGAQATAQFSDAITIFSADHDGQAGHKTTSMKVDFDPTRTGSGGNYIEFYFGESLGDYNLNSGFYRHNNYVLGDQPLELSRENGVEITFGDYPYTRTLTYDMDFTFGVPFALYGQLLASTGNSSYSTIGINDADGIPGIGIPGTARMDASHSAYWGGISDVTFDGGSVAYSLTSTSGTDWTRSLIPTASTPTEPIPAAPVPEPETYAMLVAGLGMLGVVARRKSKRGKTTS